MQSTQTHHQTSIYHQKIQVLVLQGFDEKTAEKAYLASGRDVIKASDMLHREKELNYTVQAHFSARMKGRPSNLNFMGLADEFNFIQDGAEFFEITKQVVEIKI